jgi:hypothetical protein
VGSLWVKPETVADVVQEEDHAPPLTDLFNGSQEVCTGVSRGNLGPLVDRVENNRCNVVPVRGCVVEQLLGCVPPDSLDVPSQFRERTAGRANLRPRLTTSEPFLATTPHDIVDQV